MGRIFGKDTFIAKASENGGFTPCLCGSPSTSSKNREYGQNSEKTTKIKKAKISGLSTV